MRRSIQLYTQNLCWPWIRSDHAIYRGGFLGVKHFMSGAGVRRRKGNGHTAWRRRSGRGRSISYITPIIPGRDLENNATNGVPQNRHRWSPRNQGHPFHTGTHKSAPARTAAEAVWRTLPVARVRVGVSMPPGRSADFGTTRT